MRPVSAAFIRTVSGPSHPFIARATVCETFQTGVQPIGTRVDITDGVVTIDGKADARSTADVTLATTWPVLAADLLAPYGNEIYIERGVRYSDASVEYVGLGYHRIQTPEQETLPTETPVRVTAFDRMQGIIEGRLLQPRQFLNGTTFGVVVETLIEEIYPSATIEWDDTTNLTTLTRSVIVEEDRYGFLNDAITSRGKIWYWDHRGVLVIKNVPSTTDVVFTITHGAGGNLVNMYRTLTRDNTYNAAVALGEGADTSTPVRGVAIDGDPDSPTVFGGRFGKVPVFFSSSFLTTESQCDIAAAALLNRELGLTYTATITSIVNPALEPYDPVRFKYSHSEAQRVHILDTLTIPLAATGPMDVTTREQRVVLATGG